MTTKRSKVNVSIRCCYSVLLLLLYAAGSSGSQGPVRVANFRRQSALPRRKWYLTVQNPIFDVRGGHASNYTDSQLSATATPGGDYYYPNGNNNLPPPVTGAFDTNDDPFHETVQDRVDSWRRAQMERSQSLSPTHQASPRDQEVLKLLASVSKGSRAFIFFVLMWRDVHLYEVADQSFKGFFRLVAVVPLVLLFIANMSGVVASFSSPSHSTKKRLKAILNLDKLTEAILLVWYFIRLTVAPNKYIPREIFIANTLHSVFFIIQCQAFTRLNW